MSEISKMITISTSHIEKETAEILANEDIYCPVCVYAKDDFGWFLYIDPFEKFDKLSHDLRDICKFAISKDCDVICLDCDGIVEQDLPVYEW